ncbi:MAG TPA: PqqD family protein [bacterium]|nr:PqqD family protein [bacterium]HDP99085.1 PqqD family protein [bacterium]
MKKEVLKLGDIACSIETEQSYRQLRNGEKDFTVASEKPRIKSSVQFQPAADNWMQCQSPTISASLRINAIGYQIIQRCTGKNTIEDIAFDLSDQYDFDDDEFLEYVKTFLNIFKTYQMFE